MLTLKTVSHTTTKRVLVESVKVADNKKNYTIKYSSKLLKTLLWYTYYIKYAWKGSKSKYIKLKLCSHT